MILHAFHPRKNPPRAPAEVWRRAGALLVASLLGGGAALVAPPPPAAASAAPTDLQTDGRACADTAPGPYLGPSFFHMGEDSILLQGRFPAVDAAGLQADFQVWDVADVDNPRHHTAEIPAGDDRLILRAYAADFSQAVTYAWRVRVLNGAEASPWSGTCHFTVDFVAGPAPAVASAEYPAGGQATPSGAVGVPGTFTFTSAADDTVRYVYRFSQDAVDNAVQAEGHGGPATLHWTPQQTGFHSLTVRAVDRAGNRSEPTVHEFHVRATKPKISSKDYGHTPDLAFNVGVPGRFDLRSPMPDTVAFRWWIDEDGPSGTAPADGTGRASVMIAPTRGGRQTLYVSIVGADGTVYDPGSYTFKVDNGPSVDADSLDVIIGSSVTVEARPRMPQVEAYLWWFAEPVGPQPVEKSTIAARPDGSAELIWTPTRSGSGYLGIQSRSAAINSTDASGMRKRDKAASIAPATK